MNYEETIEYLFGLEATRGWDLKLGRVRSALTKLGNPELRYPSVLIAGTNGKGTTAALVHRALSEAGFRVGIYTSPHLVSFTERIRVGDREIGRDEVVEGVARICASSPPRTTGLTFFEVSTLLALLSFAEADVDVAVLEVGLGGRLDATNVVEPVCSAITSIGLDHQAYLGDTLAEIAREKAGVMRADRPVVLGIGLPDEARTSILRQAAAVGARVVEASEAQSAVPALAIHGQRLRDNGALAIALLDELEAAAPSLCVAPDARADAFRRVRWPGRLEVIGRRPRLILDGAHNPESMAALCRELPALAGGPTRLVFGALRDKPWRDLASRLRPLVSEVVVVPLQQHRSVDPAELLTAFASYVPTRVGADPYVEVENLARAAPELPILATGSLFLVGEVYAGLLAKWGRLSIFEDPMAEVCP